MYHLIPSSTNLYWPSTSQYRHILTQYHQVQLIIHHLVRHSSASWIISLFTTHLMSHAKYTWSSFYGNIKKQTGNRGTPTLVQKPRIQKTNQTPKSVHLQEATWSSGRWDLATSKSGAPHSKQPPTGSFLSCWERAVLFPERPDFGIVLIFDLIFLAEWFQLPVVAILSQGWLHLVEDLVKQLDLLVLLPANRNLFFYFLYFILWSCKV